MSFLEKYTDRDSHSVQFEDTEGLLDGARKREINDSENQFRIRKNISLVLLLPALLIILVESIFLVRLVQENRHISTSPNGLSYKRTKDRKVYLQSKFISPNQTEASQAWDSILAGHGVISLSPAYATEKNLPESVKLPDGSGHMMYVVEAYHAMHCVQTLRSHYVDLDNGAGWDWLRPHDYHCFDALRQYIMCNVDDTILYTNGHRESGVGQTKKCQDWDALRDWTEARSAHYFDVEPEKGVRHLNNYYSGDGLPIGSLS